MIRVALLTISTRGSRGERPQDKSADTIREIVQKLDAEIIDYQMVADDKDEIISQLGKMSRQLNADLILTTGGTGLSPSDVTPEATLEVIERRLPGFEEAMRLTGFKKTPYAILSRGIVGTYGKTLIINLPGSPKGVRENLETLLPVIPHGIKVLKGGEISDDEHRMT